MCDAPFVESQGLAALVWNARVVRGAEAFSLDGATALERDLVAAP